VHKIAPLPPAAVLRPRVALPRFGFVHTVKYRFDITAVFPGFRP